MSKLCLKAILPIPSFIYGLLAGAGEFRKQPVEMLPVPELLQVLVQIIQKVLQQPDTGLAAALAAAAHKSSSLDAEELPTKAAAVGALADAVSTLANTCVECDQDASLEAWQQRSPSLAAAFNAAVHYVAAASEAAAAAAAAGAGSVAVYTGDQRALQLRKGLERLLVSLLYAEQFFFMHDSKRLPSMALTSSPIGRAASGEANELFALLLSTL